MYVLLGGCSFDRVGIVLCRFAEELLASLVESTFVELGVIVEDFAEFLFQEL
jgi:hypothetical protein